MSSSDFQICHGAQAGIDCDGSVITVQYIVNDEPVGEARVYTREEAVKLGQQLATDGYHEQFPIADVSTNDVKSFGVRLQQYGVNGQ